MSDTVLETNEHQVVDLLTERRSFDLDSRSVNERNGKIHFTGHAAVFNSPAVTPKRYTEQIMPGAFARSLAESDDVLFTVEHDHNKLLGRTSSGTLQLAEDDRGLSVRCDLPDTDYARNAAELVSRGDIAGMSFMFKPNPGGVNWTRQNGVELRSITDCKLVDVTLTAIPVYKDTDAELELRSLYDALAEARAGKMISAANKDTLQQIIDTLNSLISDENDEGPDPRSMKLDLIERYGLAV